MNKEENYISLCGQMEALMEGQKYLCTLLSNSSALLFQSLPELNWAGFYIYRDDKLILGPFQGKVACEIIPVGSGVCGTAFKEDRTVLVENVHQFPGHIACDSASNSEIVIPLHVSNQLWGVLDIDSPVLRRFNETDKYYLEKIASHIEKAIEKTEGRC